MRRLAIAWMLAALAPLLSPPPPALADEAPAAAAPAAAGDAEDASEEAAREARREQVRTCRTLAKQIAHFEQVAERARERDNELWERATEAQIDRLTRRSVARGCPQPEDGTFAAFTRLLGAAARTAARAATFGAF